jgi:hypothetical protein
VTFRHKDHRHFKVGNGEYEFNMRGDNYDGRLSGNYDGR